MYHLKRLFFAITFLLLIFFFEGCHQKKKPQTPSFVELNEQTITAFAKNIETGILEGEPAALNSVLHKENIKQLISENSIVYSGFDVEGGVNYFEHCLQLGEPLVEVVNRGGDFAFTRYYVENNAHHIVFRSYDNYLINFYDFTIDTLLGKLCIQDGFIYNAGCLLSKNIEGSMLYNLMLQTNPDSEVKWLKEIEELTLKHQHAKALDLIRNHKEALQQYPALQQLHIANLYQHNKAQFLTKLGELQGEIDPRTIYLHELLFCVNEGNVTKCEAIINELIPHVGDDPIFLFLYGYALMNAKNYQDALTCFQTVDKSMPLIWDLWQCEIKCLKALHHNEELKQCLQKGKKAYGLSDHELREFE